MTTVTRPLPDLGDLRVTEFGSFDEAAGLREEWEGLLSRAVEAEPFMTPEWLIPWWNSFGSGSLRLIAVHREQQLVGLAPFYVGSERFLGSTRWVLRFCTNAESNRAPLLVDQDGPASIAAAIMRHAIGSGGWDAARLGPLFLEGEATRLLVQALSNSDIRWGMRELHASPYLPFHGASFDDILESRSGSFRQTLKRKARKAGREEALEIDREGRATGLEDVFSIAEETWQHQQGTGIGSTPALKGFYRAMMTGARERGWLHLPIVVLNDVPVAFELNLRYQDRLYNLKLGYRDSARALSPGLVLKAEAVRYAIEQGLSEYDFLGMEEPYKLHWTDSVRRLGELWIVRHGVWPTLAHWGLFRLRPFLQRRAPWLLRVKRWLAAPPWRKR